MTEFPKDVIEDMENLSDNIWEQIQNCDLIEEKAVLAVLSSVMCELAIGIGMDKQTFLTTLADNYDYSRLWLDQHMLQTTEPH